MAITLNDKYAPLFETDKRFIIVTGGRGSAKSFAVNTFSCLLTYEKGHRILFTRWTMESAHLSIIPEFVEKLELFGVEQQFNVGAKEIMNKHTGSEILFRGIKTSSGVQTANLKSLKGITTWIVDEAEELVDEKTFNKISLSVRQSGAQNRIILILNPTTRNHWIWKRWFEKTHRIEHVDGQDVYISTNPRICHIHTTYIDNKINLPADYLNEEIYSVRQSDTHRYATEIIGGWILQPDGCLFKLSELKRFNPAELRKKEAEACFGYIDVADEGTDDYCKVVGYVFPNAIYVTDVIFTKDNWDITKPRTVALINAQTIYDKDRKIIRQMEYVRIETNNQGSIVKKDLRDLINDGGGRVLGINNSTNKHTRILLSCDNIKRNMRFLDDQYIEYDSDYHRFMIALGSYLKDGTSKHDDAPDAVSGLDKMCRSFLPHLFK